MSPTTARHWPNARTSCGSGDGHLLWAVCEHRHDRQRDEYADSAALCADEIATAFQRGDRPVPYGGARVHVERPYDGAVPHRRRPVGLTAKVWRDLVAAADQRCTYCQRRIEDPSHLHREHAVPLTRGGRDHMDNIVVACARDNRRTGTMTALEYRQFLLVRPWPDLVA